MMYLKHRLQLNLVVAVSLLAVVPTLPSAGAQDTLGTPWQGSPGITETVEQIMARQALLDAQDPPPLETDDDGGSTKKNPPKQTHNPHNPDASPRKNPHSPDVSQWPPPADSMPVTPPPGPFSPQAVGVGFLGIQLSEAPFIPPDSMGAVGPSQVLVIANGRIKVFTKAGAQSGLNSTTDNFFASVRSAGTSDPKACYDRLSGRWFITMIDVATDNRVLIAVSSASTIQSSGGWTFFQFQHDLVGTTPNSDTGGFADYDTLGVDRYALYIGVNVFNSGGTALLGTTGFVVNKSNLLSGILTVTPFRQLGNSSSGIRTPQGVSNDDPASTNGYFIGTDRNVFGQLDILRVSDPGGTPSISGTIPLTVPSTAKPISQAHKGNTLSKNLDALDDRLFSASIFKNQITGVSTLWTAHNIQVNSSGVGTSGGGRNGSRWYEIGNLTGTPTLVESGTLFDSGSVNPRGYWIPSVAASGQGHMALGCSYASSNDFAGVAASGRLRTDPLGTIQTPTLALVSSTAYNLSESPNPHRWGDFSHTVVDPNDDMTMWTFQEYCNAANSWAVRAVQLKAPLPATPTNATPNFVLQGQSNVTVVVTGASSSGSEFFDPGPDPGGPGYSNHIGASLGAAGVTINSVTFSNITNITLNISVASNATSGPRILTVTNPDGQNASSGLGIFTIQAPPSIASQPGDAVAGQGTNPPFTVGVFGSPSPSFQWRFASVPIDGATTNPLIVTNVQCSNAGSYDVVVSNYLGSVTSSPALLTVVAAPVFTVPPVDQTVLIGQPATFTAAATNDCGGGVAYQWRFQGANIAGATDTSYTRSNLQASDAGAYTVVATTLGGSATSAVATLTVLLPPSITAQPQPQALPQGSNATFAVGVSGTAPFSYQWRFNSLEIAGANASSFTRSNSQCADAGPYDVIVTNTYGAVTSGVAALTVVTPVALNSGPSNQMLVVGQALTLSVDATNDCGNGFAWQWRLGGTAITGATNSAYVRTNVLCADAGSYDVIVTNLAGSITSSIALVTITSPPLIIAQPGNQAVGAGQTAFFSITASNDCGGGLVYQWRFEGADIAGATQSGYTVTNAQPPDVGSYSAVVTNSASSITSSPALLSLLPPPTVDFSANSTSGPAPLAVTFTNLSTGATNYAWDFGDGNTSTNSAPLNTYSNPGNYTVQLSATGPGGTNSLVRSNFIVVTLPAPLLVPAASDSTNFIFSFMTFTGRTYLVEYKDSLEDPNWQTLQSNPGTGFSLFVTNSLSDPPQRFFRVRVP
jgi:PKD repeat protein